MAMEKEDFDSIGPTHLTEVDWDNNNHRRSIAASLVCGVYILERDRQEKRDGRKALAPRWWEFFHFKLLRPLIDDVDRSIFGAIYEFNPKQPSEHSTSSNSSILGAICDTLKPSGQKSSTSSITSVTTKSDSEKPIPYYVVAFRGTVIKGNSVSRDLEHDIHVIKNGFQNSSRAALGFKSIKDIVANAHGSKQHLWLAGHSLGAAMVMHCGKKMAHNRTFLDSFLFNPPFISAPIESIQDEKVKHGLRFAGSIATAGLALALSAKQPPQKAKSRSSSSSSDDDDDPFAKLSTWVPNLFVHPGDHICSEYIGYFEHQDQLDELGAGGISKLAAKHSLGGLVMTALGHKELDNELPLHLIPSACLNVNTSPAADFKTAHALKQWWRNDLQLRTKIYLKR